MLALVFMVGTLTNAGASLPQGLGGLYPQPIHLHRRMLSSAFKAAGQAAGRTSAKPTDAAFKRTLNTVDASIKLKNGITPASKNKPTARAGATLPPMTGSKSTATKALSGNSAKK
ncbi:hypothetical protein H4R33_001057 [Dimargaris cristalligena]|nr:hypothetical protein H4R33_001057 [Dimargaris cristalligena]